MKGKHPEIIDHRSSYGTLLRNSQGITVPNAVPLYIMSGGMERRVFASTRGAPGRPSNEWDQGERVVLLAWVLEPIHPSGGRMVDEMVGIVTLRDGLRGYKLWFVPALRTRGPRGVHFRKGQVGGVTTRCMENRSKLGEAQGPNAMR